MTLEQAIAEISKNAAGEWQAIEEYLNLISDLRKIHAPKQLIDDIEEIISDELNHGQKLFHWVVKLSNIQPAED